MIMIVIVGLLWVLAVVVFGILLKRNKDNKNRQLILSAILGILFFLLYLFVNDTFINKPNGDETSTLEVGSSYSIENSWKDLA